MKHLKTFESYNQVNEASDVYKFLSDKDRKEKIMTINVPQFIDQAIKFGKYKNDETGKSIELKELTKEDYEKAIELGEGNKWSNPYPFFGGSPKFLNQVDPKVKKAYEYIYQRIDKANRGQFAHTGGGGK
jgi:hypothetical protein